MTQTATVFTKVGAVHVELPPAEHAVMDGVLWGAIDAFPTPAYWTYQVLARRAVGAPAQFRLGRSLAEEVGACLLGGHGIPAAVGLAAYERLRERGAFESTSITEATLHSWLKEPLEVLGRPVRYRFAAQKARYLATALPIVNRAPSLTAGRELRDWLLRVPGIGPKTASWVARNWLGADDVAILDIHILRFGQAIGLFPRHLSVESHYTKLETLFVDFSIAVGLRASELDAVIWSEMASSPMAVRHVVQHLRDEAQDRVALLPQRTRSGRKRGGAGYRDPSTASPAP